MDRVERNWPTRVMGLALLWLGLLLGVSFVATPAKFLAPSLSLPVALDVGRQTFKLFSSIEIGFVCALVAVGLVAVRELRAWLLIALLAAIIAAQRSWLLPLLDARVATILEGRVPAASHLHEVYIGLEVVKGGALTLLAWIVPRLHPQAPATDAAREH